MRDKRRTKLSRRDFVKTTVAGAVGYSAAAKGFPSIVPASVINGRGPSERINVGAIGTGRISRGHDLPGVWKNAGAQVVAVCDADSKRLEEARSLVNG